MEPKRNHKKPNYHVDRIGFVIHPGIESSNQIKYLLAHFKGKQNGWRIYNCTGKALRYYCYLFVLSIVAHRCFCSNCQEGSMDFKRKAEKFPLRANDDFFGVMIKYYCDLKKKETAVEPKKYLDIPEKLRYGIREIFQIKRHSARAQDARVQLSKTASLETFRFWWSKDFPAVTSKTQSNESVTFSEEILPSTMVRCDILNEICHCIYESRDWAEWEEQARKRSILASKTNALHEIRDYLKKESLNALRELLHYEDDKSYINLKLKIGKVLDTAENT